MKERGVTWIANHVGVREATDKSAKRNLYHPKWRTARSTIKQRVFWSVQARSIRAENREKNEELLELIEKELAAASGTVQWNMNWCAAQICIADEGLLERSIVLGERLGLYEDYPVSKGCTSPYLPIWIGSVVGKEGGK